MFRTEDDLRAAYEVFGSADADRSIDRHTQLVRELSGAPVSKRHRRWLAPALSAASGEDELRSQAVTEISRDKGKSARRNHSE